MGRESALEVIPENGLPWKSSYALKSTFCSRTCFLRATRRLGNCIEAGMWHKPFTFLEVYLVEKYRRQTGKSRREVITIGKQS